MISNSRPGESPPSRLPYQPKKNTHYDVSKGLDRSFPQPDACPICHREGNFDPQSAFSTEDSIIHVLFICPNRDCRMGFVGTYNAWSESGQRQSPRFGPSMPNYNFPVPQAVIDLSKNGCSILKEALTAEAYGLKEICGPGFRKALEYFVKDFLIQENPSDADAIKKQLLGPCIKERVDSPNLKLVAERCVWLGNDETHYTRQQTAHDIEDLKILLRLTMIWIETHLLTAKYTTEIQSKKP